MAPADLGYLLGPHEHALHLGGLVGPAHLTLSEAALCRDGSSDLRNTGSCASAVRLLISPGSMLPKPFGKAGASIASGLLRRLSKIGKSSDAGMISIGLGIRLCKW